MNRRQNSRFIPAFNTKPIPCPNEVNPIWFVVVIFALLFQVPHMAAQTYNLTDGNSSVSGVDTGSQAGVDNWTVEGQNQLNNESFWASDRKCRHGGLHCYARGIADSVATCRRIIGHHLPKLPVQSASDLFTGGRRDGQRNVRSPASRGQDSNSYSARHWPLISFSIRLLRWVGSNNQSVLLGEKPARQIQSGFGKFRKCFGWQRTWMAPSVRGPIAERPGW